MSMRMIMFKCPGCKAGFGVDQEAMGDDKVVNCPVCNAEVSRRKGYRRGRLHQIIPLSRLPNQRPALGIEVGYV